MRQDVDDADRDELAVNAVQLMVRAVFGGQARRGRVVVWDGFPLRTGRVTTRNR